jgi:hypothetical protein
MCIECMGRYKFKIELNNDLINETLKFDVNAKVIPSPYPIILGRDTILQNAISLKCFRYFTGMSSVEALLNHVRIPVFGMPSKPRFANATAERPRLMEHVSVILRRGQVFRKEDLLTPSPDEIFSDPKDEETPPWEEEVPDTGTAPRPKVHGDKMMQERINALVQEYQGIFKSDLNPEPARLPPMKIEVDEIQWHTNVNRERIRQSSITNQTEIIKQVDKMISAGVIKRDTDTQYYSQVLLTPKPDKTWRFCIDFRRLNLCLKDLVWPIPQIEHMIRRLGREKANCYAKFDMTKGYW